MYFHLVTIFYVLVFIEVVSAYMSVNYALFFMYLNIKNISFKVRWLNVMNKCILYSV